MDFLLNTLFTSSYVGSMFLIPSSRTGGGRRDPKTGALLTRDTPRVIRARMSGVSIASVASLLAVAALAKQQYPSHSAQDLATLLGLWKPGMSLKQLASLSALPLCCTASLFLGPLYAMFLGGRLPGQHNWSFKVDVVETLKRLTGLRNFIIGPVTEELLFRSCIIGTASLYGRSGGYLIFVTPLYFGIAHAHHAYETYVLGGRTKQSLQLGVFRALFQTLYTTLFGWHASFLYLRTGNLLPPILSHIFCNVMGFPQLAESLKDFPHRKWAILGAYIVGIVAYSKSLWPLTNPTLFGGSDMW